MDPHAVDLYAVRRALGPGNAGAAPTAGRVGAKTPDGKATTRALWVLEEQVWVTKPSRITGQPGALGPWKTGRVTGVPRNGVHASAARSRLPAR